MFKAFKATIPHNTPLSLKPLLQDMLMVRRKRYGKIGLVASLLAHENAERATSSRHLVQCSFSLLALLYRVHRSNIETTYSTQRRVILILSLTETHTGLTAPRLDLCEIQPALALALLI